MADEIVVIPSTEKKEEIVPSQDPIKAELEKAKQKKEFTEQEKVSFNLRKNIEKAKSLGIDPKSIIGDEDEEKTEEIPEWYRREKAKEAEKTSIQLADQLADSDEKSLVKDYLANRIKSSGDADSDFRLALGAVRSLKNAQILADVNRRQNPRMTAAGGSAPINHTDEFVPTDTEAVFMQPPYNLSKEKIIEARRKVEAKG